jgi:hypothetical protein
MVRIVKLNQALSLCALAVMISGVLTAGPIYHPLGEQHPADFGFNTNNPVNATRGWRFLVNSSDVVVTQLGVETPASGAYPVTVTLFGVGTQGVLAQAATTPGPGWRWVDLGTPVPLTLGAEYIVAMYTGTDGSYYWKGGLPSSWYPTGTIQYLDMRYANDVGASVFPTDVLSGYQYGVPDIGYELGVAAIPEPLTGGMTGIGLILLGVGARAFRRRRSAD